VLDDLHQDDGVEAGQSFVGVRDRRLQELQAFPLPIRQVVVPQSPLGPDQRPRRHVGRDQLADHRVLEQFADERALAAADVGDPARAEFPQYAGHGRPALHGQRRLLRRVVGQFGAVCLGETFQCRVSQVAAVCEVASGDEVLVRVAGEPAVAGPDELLDLVRSDPVVLGVVEDGQHHVQVIECVRQSQYAGQPQVDVPRVTPGRDLRVERHRSGVDGPTERREQAFGEFRAPAARQGRDVDMQRDRAGGEFRACVAAAVHRRTEEFAERDREQAGGGVRAVVHILPEGEPVHRAAALHERDRVDLEQDRRRTGVRRGFGVEHVRRSPGDVDRLRTGRVLVQQEPEIARRCVDAVQIGAEGQEHRRIRSRTKDRDTRIWVWRVPANGSSL
jgi:hypothetical protein